MGNKSDVWQGTCGWKQIAKEEREWEKTTAILERFLAEPGD